MEISDTLVTNLTKGISNYISENPYRHMIRIMADFINIDVTIVNDDCNLLDGEIIAVEDEEGLYLTIGRFPSDREMLIAFLERLKKYHKDDYQKIVEKFCNTESSKEFRCTHIVNTEEEMRSLENPQINDYVFVTDLSVGFVYTGNDFVQLSTPKQVKINNTLTCYSEEDLKSLNPQDGDVCYVQKSGKVYVFNNNKWEYVMMNINDFDIVIADHKEHNEIEHNTRFKIMDICFVISISIAVAIVIFCL